ncbi:MAG: hypothetical protein HKL82_05990 [Acidimicrobiaceae bacterium]|nr:hypothetical protein [Acidimicrobiaceae bacterium]
MALFVLRIWLEDRPGALGAVASRIGAVKGDLVGIEILERGGGRAIDELLVELPFPELVSLMIREISEVDGVDVEDVREASDDLRDVRISALEAVALLVDQTDPNELLSELVATAVFDYESDWAAVVRTSDGEMLIATGEVPISSWLSAFVEGVLLSNIGSETTGPDDVAWGPLARSGLAMIIGRAKRPYRAIEREQLILTTRIADARYIELVSPSR